MDLFHLLSLVKWEAQYEEDAVSYDCENRFETASFYAY